MKCVRADPFPTNSAGHERTAEVKQGIDACRVKCPITVAM